MKMMEKVRQGDCHALCGRKSNMKTETIFPIPEMSADWIKNELHKKFPPAEAQEKYRELADIIVFGRIAGKNAAK